MVACRGMLLGRRVARAVGGWEGRARRALQAPHKAASGGRLWGMMVSHTCEGDQVAEGLGRPCRRCSVGLCRWGCRARRHTALRAPARLGGSGRDRHVRGRSGAHACGVSSGEPDHHADQGSSATQPGVGDAPQPPPRRSAPDRALPTERTPRQAPAKRRVPRAVFLFAVTTMDLCAAVPDMVATTADKSSPMVGRKQGRWAPPYCFVTTSCVPPRVAAK